MPIARSWLPEEDEVLRTHFHLTNEALAAHLRVSELSVKKRFEALGIHRPKGKNNLARARCAIFRENSRGKVPEDWFNLPSTRADAKDQGVPFYWDGQLCDRANHLSKRKTSSGGCWDCDYGDHKIKLKTDADFVIQRKEQSQNRYRNNRDSYLEKQRERKSTPESREWYKNYEKQKREHDIEWRLAKSLRDRLYKAVTRPQKNTSSKILVGCSVEDLKIHLERQFTGGMCWDNYGKWHIDHIRPCISFDLSDPAQQNICFHYTNLRPLWGEENRSKGGSWDGFDPRTQKRQKLLGPDSNFHPRDAESDGDTAN